MSNSVLVPHKWTAVETPLRDTALYLYDHADEMQMEHVQEIVKLLTPAFEQFDTMRRRNLEIEPDAKLPMYMSNSNALY